MSTQSAKAKADRLLKSALTDQQKQDLENKGWFDVRGSSGRIYRVRGPREYFCSVQRIGALGLRFRRRCFETIEKLPMADMLLAAKIWLERDETEFFAMIGSKQRLRSFFRYPSRREMRSLAASRRIDFG
jgi:hypothetical protein